MLKIKELLEDRTLSQKWLIMKLLEQNIEVTPSMLSRYVNGESVMPNNLLKPMAHIFEVTVDEILE